MALRNGPDDPSRELSQRVFDLYLDIFDKDRPPDIRDITRIVYILRLMQRAGLMERKEAPKGPIGRIADMFDVTPGVLLVMGVLIAVLGGNPVISALIKLLTAVGVV